MQTTRSSTRSRAVASLAVDVSHALVTVHFTCLLLWPAICKGVVSPSIAAGYRQAVNWLREQTGSSGTLGLTAAQPDASKRGQAILIDHFPRLELLELSEWRGWSSAVCAALLMLAMRCRVYEADAHFCCKFTVSQCCWIREQGARAA